MRIPVTIFAALLAFQASAQENKITVAGRAWGSVENVSTTGAPGTSPNVRPRFRVNNDSSFVRVRGDLKLTDDLSAWGQVEAQFAFDGANGSTPFDATRETGAGFTSKLAGTIMAGRWGTPTKLATISLDPWGQTGILNYSGIIGQLPSGTNLYDARYSNTIQYWSPSISGLQVKLAFVPNEDKTTSMNPWAFSGSVTWTGPLFLAASYESRKNCSGAGGTAATNCTGSLVGGANGTGTDQAIRVGAGFNNKPTATAVGAVFEHLESKGSAPGGPERKETRDAYYASLVQGLPGTGHEIALGFGIAAKAGGDFLATNDKTGALFFTAAYRYNFTKDLMAYLGYVTIKNDDNAKYTFGASGFSGASAGIQANGADPQGIVIGSRYLF